MTFTGGTMRVIGVCMCDTSLMPSVPCENNNMPVITMREMAASLHARGG